MWSCGWGRGAGRSIGAGDRDARRVAMPPRKGDARDVMRRGTHLDVDAEPDWGGSCARSMHRAAFCAAADEDANRHSTARSRETSSRSIWPSTAFVRSGLGHCRAAPDVTAMSHAVRHVARRIARAVATSTPRTRTPVAEARARPRAFSRGADGSPGSPGAPLGVAPPGAPGPRGPGGGEQRKGFVSWPGLAFLIAAPVAYYLSGGPDDVGEKAHRPVQASATKGSQSARKPPAADAPKPERTKATTPKEETRTEATEEEDDVDVFRAAAELLARDLDPSPEGAEKRVEESKAERKERRRAEKRARREADRGDESGASGPAGAARARALANQPDLSEEDKEEEDGAEAMTAAALVTRAFEGAVEVRPRTSTQTFPQTFASSFFFFSTAATLSCRDHTRCRVGLFTQPERRGGARLLLNFRRVPPRRGV